MSRVIAVMLCIVGFIHLLPAAGVLGADRLTALYGIPVTEPNLEILMRHRAVLFGMLGVFLIYAAFRPALRGTALLAGALSVGSFLWLAGSVQEYNASLARVVTADVVAAACLLVAAAAHLYGRLRDTRRP